MPSAAKIMEMRAEPSRCPEPAEGLLELCRVQPKLWKFYCIIPSASKNFIVYEKR